MIEKIRPLQIEYYMVMEKLRIEMEKQATEIPCGYNAILLEDCFDLKTDTIVVVLDFLQADENLKAAYVVETNNKVYTIEAGKLKQIQSQTPLIPLEEFRELLLEHRRKLVEKIERLEQQKLQNLEKEFDDEVALRLHKKFQSGQEIK